MNEKWRRECRLPIPKGLRPSAQGWRASAYPGCAFGIGNNANGVAAHSPTLRPGRYVGLRIKRIEQPQRGCGRLCGVNLYEFVRNNPVGFVDFFGLKSISFRLAGDALIDVLNLGGIDAQLGTVRNLLAKCKCEDIQVDFEWDWSWKSNQMPSDGRWIFDRDHDLANKTWNQMGHDKVPVILTGLSITVDGEREGGVTYRTQGIIITAGDIWFYTDSGVLAHELGHYAGYKGDKNGHSSDAKNIMHNPITGRNPDKEYCEKVSGLAK